MPDVGHWIHSDAEMNNIYDYVLNYQMEAFTFKDVMHEELKKINDELIENRKSLKLEQEKREEK